MTQASHSGRSLLPVIIAIKTDTAEATVLLLCPSQGNVGAYGEVDKVTWMAGRRLSGQLLSQITQLLHRQSAAWSDLAGIIVYEGPGSFTGLRIGVTVANVIAYSLNIPVVAASTDDWWGAGLRYLPTARPGQIALPVYGAEPNITKPKR